MEGFIERLIKYRSVYQAFYGSLWWHARIPVIWHIGFCVLQYISWRNSKIPTITIDEFNVKYGADARINIENQIKKHIEGKIFHVCK